ncbi:MAG: aldo/keto reductase [Bryobacterales bacterium]|nr:aldo/keto reductase [Bryobacterales bacterium]
MLAGGAIAASPLVSSGAAGALERRPLGKTGIEVGILGIGMSPLGQPGATQEEMNRVIAMAADEGVNYLDAAPIYGMAERRLGPALKGKRDKFVLVSKVEATSNQDATWQIKESLHKMQTDYLDVVHLHNVGRTDRFPDLDVLMGEDGALQALRDAKKEGMIRHIGLTCHLRPARASDHRERRDRTRDVRREFRRPAHLQLRRHGLRRGGQAKNGCGRDEDPRRHGRRRRKAIR